MKPLLGRKVHVFSWEKESEKRGANMIKVLLCSGTFLGFGVDYEDINFSAGIYSTAIIEDAFGEVMNVPVELIKFKVEGEENESNS